MLSFLPLRRVVFPSLPSAFLGPSFIMSRSLLCCVKYNVGTASLSQTWAKMKLTSSPFMDNKEEGFLFLAQYISLGCYCSSQCPRCVRYGSFIGCTIHIVACEEKGPVDRVPFLPPKPTPHLGQRAHAPQPTPPPQSLPLCPGGGGGGGGGGGRVPRRRARGLASCAGAPEEEPGET